MEIYFMKNDKFTNARFQASCDKQHEFNLA